MLSTEETWYYLLARVWPVFLQGSSLGSFLKAAMHETMTSRSAKGIALHRVSSLGYYMVLYNQYIYSCTDSLEISSKKTNEIVLSFESRREGRLLFFNQKMLIVLAKYWHYRIITSAYIIKKIARVCIMHQKQKLLIY